MHGVRSSPMRLVWTGSAALALGLSACSDVVQTSYACTNGAPLTLGFYAYYEPISYSLDEDPGSPGFNDQAGYEADLVAALEAIDDAELSFNRRGIRDWPGIWLLSSEPGYDMVGGGITILDERTRDAQGQPAVAFTRGHVAFRQSILVRAGEVERYDSYAKLTSDVRVGALAGTTGEARLLQVVALVDDDGVLAEGVRVETPQGTVTADGTDAYVITASEMSPVLEGRTLLLPPDDSRPQVVYLGYERGETELLEGLRDGTVDAVARGEIGNSEAAHVAANAFAISVLDSLVEYGGFTVDADDSELLGCLDNFIDWLTDGRQIGFPEWQADRMVFMKRAREWSPQS